MAGTTSHLNGEREDFKFRTLGLYNIVLIVRFNDNKTASTFTAVYSIIDLDSDGMPVGDQILPVLERKRQR